MKTAGNIFIAIGGLALVAAIFMQTTVTISTPSFSPYGPGGTQNVANLQAMHFQAMAWQAGLGFMIFGAVLLGAGSIQETLLRAHGLAIDEPAAAPEPITYRREDKIVAIVIGVLMLIGVLAVVFGNLGAEPIPPDTGNYLTPEEDASDENAL